MTDESEVFIYINVHKSWSTVYNTRNFDMYLCTRRASTANELAVPICISYYLLDNPLLVIIAVEDIPLFFFKRDAFS